MRFQLTQIDAVLDRVTMYRLTLYVLTAFIVVALIEATLGFIPYSPITILYSAVLATAACWGVNTLAAKLVGAATSVESVYISAFILTLILPPAELGNISSALVVVGASVAAMGSKYFLAPHKKHLFNPAAFGVVVMGLFAGGVSTSWWISENFALIPFVLIGGLLIVRKIRRFDLVLAFTLFAVVTLAITTGGDLWTSLKVATLELPLVFFALIMLTEPLTTPPTRILRIAYGALIGILSAPALHFGNLYSSPELALVLGNLFSYFVSPKGRMSLTLEKAEQTGASTRDLIFKPDAPITFHAGQFLEWTLPHAHPDSRGTRRFFTIASSPTEPNVRLGVKFYPKPSTFKQSLFALTPGARLFATQLGGEFTLPEDANKKLVFIAGGIGITPFRSHFRYLLDTKQKRDIVMLYANRTPADIAYGAILDEAAEKFGAKIVHVISDGAEPGMRSGAIDAALIQSEVPDYRERHFYISGPQAMVSGVKATLLSLGVSRRRVHTDYFVGLA